MAFFNIKKNKETITPVIKEAKKIKVKEERKSKPIEEVTEKKNRRQGSSFVIVRPRITEKAGNMAEQDTYTFDVTNRANKKNVKEQVAELYNVTPLTVRMVTIQKKSVFSRGKKGTKKGGKKAYVTLKKGEKIEFV